MKLLAIIPFGFFIFFCGTSLETARDAFNPEYSDLWLTALGVAWLQLVGVILAGAATYGLVRYAPWGLPR